MESYYTLNIIKKNLTNNKLKRKQILSNYSVNNIMDYLIHLNTKQMNKIMMCYKLKIN